MFPYTGMITYTNATHVLLESVNGAECHLISDDFAVSKREFTTTSRQTRVTRGIATSKLLAVLQSLWHWFTERLG
jgi:hypothetical protein